MKYLVLCTLLAAASVASAQVGQFGTPVNVTAANSAQQDYYPYISGDNLTLRIGSSRTDIPGSPGGWDIYMCTRPDTHSPFGPVTREPGINGTTNDLSQHMLSDELTAYYAASHAGGKGGHDIWMATRNAPNLPWGNITNVGAASSTGADYGVSVTDKDDYLLVINGANVMECTRLAPTLPWNLAQVVPELNVGTGRRDMGMSLDGLTVYYGVSGMPGGAGGYDIVVSRRTFLTDKWGPPQLVANVSDPGTDRSPKPSPDGRQLFFSSGRAGGVGGQDVWMAQFTGLSYQFLPRIASPVDFHITTPNQTLAGYQVAMALSDTPGILIPGIGTIPLAFDDLFKLTAQNKVPSLFANFGGTTDAFGEATATFNVPPILGLVGIPFYTAAVVFDASGITITNGLKLGIHR